MESLITLTEEVSFRNCFDKALVLMITRGMDVKKLVNSDVFFPKIWRKKNIYCAD